MTNFLFGILASVLAAPFVYILGRLFSPFLGSWSAYFNLVASARRLQRAGILNIIPSRSDYRLLRGGETIRNYLLKNVQHSLVYIGFWHAKGIEMDNISDTFLDLLQRGCTIELILLDENIADPSAEMIAKYLGLSLRGLRERVAEAWRFGSAFRQRIPTPFAGHFVMKSHLNAIYASSFIIDHTSQHPRLLVDIKIFGLGRESGFALELVRTGDPNNLYDRFYRSFMKVSEAAQIKPPDGPAL